MAIRTELLGGTDFVSGRKLLSTDLNDTFNEIVRLVENGY